MKEDKSKEKTKIEKLKEVLNRVNESIDNLNNKNFTIYFFVIDTKGTPNGSIQYIYEMGMELINLGYNVKMLHQESEYTGVSEWLGDEYDAIPHGCIENENIKVSTSDFLIIPEIFSNVMSQTKDLPCKRIILCQNINHITEFIPLGVSWNDYNINNVITTSQLQANDLKKLFPILNIDVINPGIPEYFRNNDEPKKMMVSIVTKDQSLMNKIVKQFHWKFPQYRWVTFTDLRSMPRRLFADTLRESAITIWVDDETYFGYVPIEAIKSGSITIGKVPDIIPEWMYNNDNTGLSKAGVWFNDMRDVQKITANAIKSVLDDLVPEDLYNAMKDFDNRYTMEQRKAQISNIFNKYVSSRLKEIEVVKTKAISELELLTKNK
jgi:hypothetical protein